MKYNTLVLSGGGIKFALLLGALLNVQHPFQYYAGASAGAILCYLLAIGYTSQELYELFVKEGLIVKLSKPHGLRLFLEKGMIDMGRIRALLEDLTLAKHQTLHTFESLQETGVHLAVPAYNLSTHTLVYFSSSTPTIPVIDAVIASCTIPLLCPRMEIEGQVYIDGGIVDNFPISFFSGEEHTILGLDVGNYTVDLSTPTGYATEISRIPFYLFRQYRTPVNATVIHLDTEISSMKFNLSSKEVHELIELGKSFTATLT